MREQISRFSPGYCYPHNELVLIGRSTPFTEVPQPKKGYGEGYIPYYKSL